MLYFYELFLKVAVYNSSKSENILTQLDIEFGEHSYVFLYVLFFFIFSVSFTLTQGLEGGTAGLLLIITIIYCFYVMADRSRTRAVAISIILMLVVTGINH